MEEIDLFVFGTPHEQSPEFCEHQLELQQRFGGELISPIHFTFQHLRMFGDDKSDLQARLHLLYSDIESLLNNIPAFPIVAYSVVALFSEFRQARVLKWHIVLTTPLQQMADRLSQIGSMRGLGPLSQEHAPVIKLMLPSRWISDQITALENIEQMGFHRNLELIRVPDPLFNIEKVLVAQFTNQDGFTTLNEFSLAA